MQCLVEYLESLLSIKISNDRKEFKCPVCGKETAFLYPNQTIKFYCNHPDCEFKGDVFDLVRKTKNKNFSDEDIADYLSHKFTIEIKDDVQDILKLYEKNKFCLFPLEPESKNPQKGFMWKDRLYKEPKLWNDWVDRGYGLALRLGKVSNVVAIDVDDDETYEKMKDLLGEDTLIQVTKRGRHWLFLYEDCFDNINHVNFRSKNGYDMELRGNNAYIAIAPTSAEGEIRTWNNKKIQKMPEKLKEFLLSLIDKDTKNVDEEIQDAINNEDLGNGVQGMDGRCNDTFVKMGGILRKKMNIENTKTALSVFNQALDNPMPDKDIRGIIRQLGKYQTYDKQELADEVLKRLEIITEGTAFQIANTLKREQKDVEDVLKHLEDEAKVVAMKGRKYKVLENVEWVEDESEMGKPIDFIMPYFHNIAHFNDGGMIIIGSPTGKGKSHITGNIIKQLWEQKRVSHLVNTEADSNIGKIITNLNIPKEAYVVPKKKRKPITHPMDIELADNAITLVDWLRMKDGDFTQTDNTFEHFSKQLKIHRGFLIILTQIRTSDNKFFAPDQVANFGALVCKYLWGNNGIDNENTYFLTTKIRDSKINKQIITLPCFYEHSTKIIELRNQ